MRVCLVSTYAPQRCGIATYTASLARALAGSGEPPQVISERVATRGEDAGVESWPTFDRHHDYTSEVLERATQLDAEVVHVQHAPDIFGMDERMPRLLSALRARGIATVVTLHTVHNTLSGAVERRFGVRDFHRRLAASADALIVHGGPAMAKELVRQGIERAKVHEIAHGTPEITPWARAEARRHLDLPGSAKVLLCFGFIHPQKNLHTVLLAMHQVRRHVPDALLYIVGSIQNRTAVNRLYLRLLSTLAARPSLSDNVIVREQFVPADGLPALYGASDVVLVPYAQGYGSASGIAHQAIGAHRVPLCSRSPKFSEIGSAIDPGLVVSTYNPRAWADAMTGLLTHPERLASLAEKVESYARDTSWPNIALQHERVYRAVAA